MESFDNHPPRHASVGELNNPDRLNIHKQIEKSTFLDFFFGSRKVFFTTKEIAVLAEHGETPISFLYPGKRMPKKVYVQALEQKQRAQIWIKEKENNFQKSNDYVNE